MGTVGFVIQRTSHHWETNGGFRMKSKIVISVAVVAVLVAATMVLAAGRGRMAPPAGQPGMCGVGPGCGMGMGVGPMMARELNLTQDQIARMQQLRDDYLAATKATREQLQAKCRQMCALWTAAQPDAGQIKALAADMDALRAELRDAGIDHRIAALGVLTAEQRTKLQEMLKNSAAKCAEMGCGACLGPGMGCGIGPGMGAGMGKGPGPGCGAGSGMGAGMGNGTGPRAQAGTCPRLGQ